MKYLKYLEFHKCETTDQLALSDNLTIRKIICATVQSDQRSKEIFNQKQTFILKSKMKTIFKDEEVRIKTFKIVVKGKT